MKMDQTEKGVCEKNDQSSKIITSILSTSFGVLPSTFIPLTSITSSPQDMRPDRSAAPPCITRAINIRPVPSSALIVAP